MPCQIRILAITFQFLILAFVARAQMSVIGPATPANDWDTDFDMIQNTENPDLWSLTLLISSNEIKFRQGHNWVTNWGGTFPSGIAVFDGLNIYVSTPGYYHITFNVSSFEFSFSLGKVGINTPDPQVALDLDGALRTQAHYFDASGGFISIPATYSFIILDGTPVFAFYVTMPGAVDGVYLIVDNSTTQTAILPGTATVPPGTTRHFIYSQGDWKQTSSSFLSSGNGWNLEGNLGTNEGIHAIGTLDDQDLAIKTNGTERARVTSSGRMGIGVADPLGKLQVNGNATFSNPSIVIADSSTTNVGGGVLQFRSTAWDNQFNLKGSIGNLNDGGNSYLDFFFKSNTLMSLDGLGRLGIGVLEPSYPLDIAVAGSSLLRVKNSNTLTNNVHTNIDFYTGDYVTGRISTIGQATNQARIGFSTGASFPGGAFILQERLTISNTGRIGINYINPLEQLEINGNATIFDDGFLEFGRGISGKETNAGKMGYGLFGDPGSLHIVGAGTLVENRKIRLWAEGGTTLQGGAYVIGNISIGTPDVPVGYQLAVKGKIIAEEVRCQLFADWPDYVFHQDYKLMSIDDLQKEIDRLGHLPGIPSAKEIDDAGVDLGDMQVRMMEKIEQLTLYIIELNEKIEVLEKQQTAINR